MDCPANNIDDEGNIEDPITYAPLDAERRLQVGRLCYAPESLADWMLEKNDIVDMYNVRLNERQLLDLLHFLDRNDDDEYYPKYNKLALLIADRLRITLAYMIYLEEEKYPETMTHYSSKGTALQQARYLTSMDRRERFVGVHAITDDIRFSAPLQYYIRP